MPRRLLVALAVLGLSACANARERELKLPSFTHLESRAVESVDITLGSLPLTMAGWFLDEHDPDNAAIKSTLKGLKTLRVRHYEFDTDFAYSKADIDAVRSQLSRKGWSPIAQVRNRNKNEDVDVYISIENDKITGFAVVASEPREFTIVNAVGSLDLAQVERLRKHFNSRGDDSRAADSQGDGGLSGDESGSAPNERASRL